MAFSSNNHDDIMSEMNITPLVDVMLVLLVVFIVTAPMLTNAIPVNLPKTSAVAPADRPDPLVVSVDGTQQLFLNKQAMAREQLLSQLTEAQRANSDVVVQVQADKDASYGTVAALLADIEQSGIHRLALLTQK
ncbi:biopolymer transporter ExbD [Raoultella sp. WB_B2P2-3]|jgi:biopolymer transport protein TolR|uniref:Biopolymer transporter ExbD n=1 Tax=Raoultella scottii TaxID=3040937 RepID=A0ABU8ZAC9_9ENTR|nr:MULTISPECIES: biopolymer transporter ExbD [Enterobacteriaceae]MVT02147.1 biopolymer transporter ExbD [Raoultella sp. 10-1]PAC14660.1 biopolymer transporter ExbD [Enterobacter sp. 10-1]HBR1414090.1 biopolymer transporter ExbD [Klebsiella pneumoniae]HBR1477758.1 biopolymer transporter ExbD [Klebsiella pneumoniae]